MYVSYSLNKFVTVFKGLFATGNRFYLDHLKRNEIYVKIYEDIYYSTTWFLLSHVIVTVCSDQFAKYN